MMLLWAASCRSCGALQGRRGACRCGLMWGLPGSCGCPLAGSQSVNAGVLALGRLGQWLAALGRRPGALGSSGPQVPSPAPFPAPGCSRLHPCRLRSRSRGRKREQGSLLKLRLAPQQGTRNGRAVPACESSTPCPWANRAMGHRGLHLTGGRDGIYGPSECRFGLAVISPMCLRAHRRLNATGVRSLARMTSSHDLDVAHKPPFSTASLRTKGVRLLCFSSQEIVRPSAVTVSYVKEGELFLLLPNFFRIHHK